MFVIIFQLKSIQQTANDLVPIGLKVPIGQEQDSEDEGIIPIISTPLWVMHRSLS